MCCRVCTAAHEVCNSQTWSVLHTHRCEHPRVADLANETGGAVKADISQDRNSGRSRGFGTVLFETAEQAEACIQVGSSRAPFEEM